MRPVLFVGNQNYSSWSMRPWLVLTWAGISFETRVIRLGGPGYTLRTMPSVLAVNPGGTVPALQLGAADTIGDSLAIAEWAAEQVPSLWPAEATARMHARAAACEMHSGFAALRSKLPCNIRRRAKRRELDEATQRDVTRLETLWTSLRTRFGSGGDYLFGAKPTIADAFFTPVATRMRTYDVAIGPASQRYVDALLAEPAFRAWEAAGVAEEWTMPEWDAF